MMYVQFPLSLRNVEDLLHERGIDIDHETIRAWWNRSRSIFSADVKRCRVKAIRVHTQWRWHVDEIYVKNDGEIHYLWRAVDHEGEVLKAFVSKLRDRRAALMFVRNAMTYYGEPRVIVRDGLKSFDAALRDLRLEDHQETGRWRNNRAENSHQPLRRRERKMQGSRRRQTLERFAAVNSSVFNHFNKDSHLNRRDVFKTDRDTALAERRQRGAA